jgi:hypothetical protein
VKSIWNTTIAIDKQVKVLPICCVEIKGFTKPLFLHHYQDEYSYSSLFCLFILNCLHFLGTYSSVPLYLHKTH